MTSSYARVRRPAGLLAVAAMAASAAACAPDDDDGWGDAPGANARVGDVLVRYAHLEDPATTDVHPEGSDVPLYVWLSNGSDEPVALVDASSEVAADVVPTAGDLPVTLPPGELVELGRTGRHLELQGTTRRIAGQDLVPVTLELEPGGPVTLQVEMVEVLPGEAGGE